MDNFCKALLFLFLLSITNNLSGQNFQDLRLYPFSNIDYLKDNSVSIEPIKKVFEKHNLVLLAESTHYDGGTIDAQCMIIKELINSGTINTLYLESSWLNAEKIMAILLSEGKAGINKAKRYAASGEFIYWIDNDFWDFLVEKIIDRKLRIVGIDIETNSWSLINELYNEAKNQLANGLTISDFRQLDQCYLYFEQLAESIHFSQELYEMQHSFIGKVKTMYGKSSDSLRLYQWSLIEKYFYWLYKRQFCITSSSYETLHENMSNIEVSLFNSIRDSIMAGIFLEDYLKNKDVRAIIKTSAYHALRNYKAEPQIQNVFINDKVHIFNEIINATLPPGSVFSICFASSSGRWGLDFLGNENDTKPIKVSKNGIEGFFSKQNQPYFFTNFQENTNFDSSKGFEMKVVFQKNIKANWTKIFSGLFFIKEMYPIKYLYPEKHKWL